MARRGCCFRWAMRTRWRSAWRYCWTSPTTGAGWPSRRRSVCWSISLANKRRGPWAGFIGSSWRVRLLPEWAALRAYRRAHAGGAMLLARLRRTSHTARRGSAQSRGVRIGDLLLLGWVEDELPLLVQGAIVVHRHGLAFRR